jgi:hypothetical protein
MEGCEALMIYDIAGIVMIIFSGALGWLLSTTYLTPKIEKMNLQQSLVVFVISSLILILCFRLYYMVL